MKEGAQTDRCMLKMLSILETFGTLPISQIITALNALGQAASDVFTKADILIQKTIEYNLKELYPRAKIIGKNFHKSLNFCVRAWQVRKMTQTSHMHMKIRT